MDREYKINAAIQLLPGGNKERAYQIIDEAIEIIENSGLKCKICPFETVVEGEFSAVIEIIRQIRDKCFEEGVDEILMNLKLQMGAKNDILIKDKMSKYE